MSKGRKRALGGDPLSKRKSGEGKRIPKENSFAWIEEKGKEPEDKEEIKPAERLKPSRVEKIKEKVKIKPSKILNKLKKIEKGISHLPKGIIVVTK